MEQKLYRSNALKRAYFIGRIKWLIPLLVILYTGISNFGKLRAEYLQEPRFIAIAGILFNVIGIGILKSAIPFILVHEYSKQAKYEEIKNSTFNTVNDFQYFREKLKELSPTDISILADLKIEKSKDLSATLMSLEKQGILDSKNGSYRVIDDSKITRKSDAFLVNCISNNRLTQEKEDEWKLLCEDECFNKGLVRENKHKTMSVQMGCLPAIIFLVIFTTIISMNTEFMNKVESLGDKPQQYFSAMAKDPRLILFFIGGMVAVFCLVYVFYAPIIMLFSFLGFKMHASNIIRTTTGNKYAEMIYGMKNYIHDFSNLSTADKEKIALWDEYLIYAVVLEENEQIIKEVTSLKNAIK